jgi:hypothetical protein
MDKLEIKVCKEFIESKVKKIDDVRTSLIPDSWKSPICYSSVLNENQQAKLVLKQVNNTLDNAYLLLQQVNILLDNMNI